MGHIGVLLLRGGAHALAMICIVPCEGFGLFPMVVRRPRRHTAPLRQPSQALYPAPGPRHLKEHPLDGTDKLGLKLIDADGPLSARRDTFVGATKNGKDPTFHPLTLGRPREAPVEAIIPTSMP